MLSVRNLDEKQKPDVGLEWFRRRLGIFPGWNGTLPGATSVPHDDRGLIFKKGGTLESRLLLLLIPFKLGSRNCGPIRRNDLYLVRKHLSAAWVHGYFDPIHVVVAVGLIVTKCFDTRKVLEPAALCILKGLVDPHVM